MHLKGLKCWWNACFFIFSSWQTLTKHAQALRKTTKRKHDLHKTCTGIKKNKKNKAWSSQNLHRHQKNKKNKTFVIYRPPTLSRCSEFCFFCFFWCLCRFCASSGLFFLFFLMPVQVLWLKPSPNMHRHQKKTKKTKHDLHKTCTGIKKTKKTKLLWSIDPQPWVDAQSFFLFFWCLCRFCDSNLHQTCTGIKKTKKTKHDLHKTCTGIKKTKKNKTFVIYRPPTLSRCSEFCFFLVFLMPVQVLCI